MAWKSNSIPPFYASVIAYPYRSPRIVCQSRSRTLQWRHNDHDDVSNHQPHGCLLNRLFRRRSKKTSKLRVTGLCVGNSPGPVNSPHKGPVTRKKFPFDDVIMKGRFFLFPLAAFLCWFICIYSYILCLLEWYLTYLRLLQCRWWKLRGYEN